LRALHRPGRPLLLPNVWDAGSARLVESAGLGAVATSSGAVAESLGYTDHEGAPVDEMLAAAARIARAVSVPVTVDAESGYRLPAEELVGRLLAAGVAGCNLEDTDHRTGRLADPRQHARWLAEVRAAAGGALVLNARIDVFLRAPDEAGVLADGLDRARRYLDSGADCVYPIVAAEPATIAGFVALGRPVNMLLRPGGPDLATAAELGVARVSLGSGLWRSAMRLVGERVAALAAGRPAN
jgi:2-methylisocitrate lyase-like PEP mutase family enzyme